MSSSAFDELRAKITGKQALVGIIGLGYVGLPLARAFTDAGFRVLGFDIDPGKIAQLDKGQSYLSHIPSHVVAAMLRNGFSGTSDFNRLGEPDAVIVCVPTPLTDAREPDLTFVLNSTHAIAARLRAGQLVVLESTTYPGTTREKMLPLLAATGLTVGRDFFLAFSPEREDPGNTKHSAATIPKVVGGIDAPSRELAVTLYGRVVVEVVPVSSPEVAEACKILENTYRAVNIALVNELKILYGRMGIDIWEVIDAARTKPFGFQAFYPGPGLGGHCIPIDPFYLTWVARRHGLSTRFIELAGEINTGMPTYVVSRLADALNERGKPIKGSKIVILGMAYKKDVDDSRESPGFELMELLQHKGAVVTYNDPFVPHLPPTRKHGHLHMSSRPLTPDFLRSQDAVLIATDHTQYDWPAIVRDAALVIDTRNATRHVTEGREKIVRA
jgi:UDP-N-acetyl-D-glucosamine dehydrogenase